MNPYKFKTADLLLAGFIVILAAGIFFFYNKEHAFRESPSQIYAVVKIDGKEYRRYALNQDSEDTIVTERGTNQIRIHKGVVNMQSADCPDKICVHEKPISHPGETITCLPHHLTVEIEGGKPAENQPDSISN